MMNAMQNVSRQWQVSMGLADKYSNGYGVDQDYEKAHSLYSGLAKQEGDVALRLGALIKLSDQYFKGQGCSENHAKSAMQLDLAAALAIENKNYSIAFSIAERFYTGGKIEQDYKRAYALSVALAKKSDDIKIQLSALCMAFDLSVKGWGCLKDPLHGLQLFEEAAEQAKSMTDRMRIFMLMGYRLYSDGHMCDTCSLWRDQAHIRKIFNEVADKAKEPFLQKKATIALAEMYRCGHGGEVDYNKAFTLFSEQVGDSDNGWSERNCYSCYNVFHSNFSPKNEDLDGEELSQAAFSLGEMYRLEQGVAKNSSKAKSIFDWVREQHAWYRGGQRCKDSTYARATLSLATLYCHGDGVWKNYSKARELIHEACKNKVDFCNVHAGELAEFGDIYFAGRGVEKDFESARTFYKKVAMKKNDPAAAAYAQRMLGDMYRLGKGVPVDYAQAREFYEPVMLQTESKVEKNKALAGMKALCILENRSPSVFVISSPDPKYAPTIKRNDLDEEVEVVGRGISQDAVSYLGSDEESEMGIVPSFSTSRISLSARSNVISSRISHSHTCDSDDESQCTRPSVYVD
jgi:hypothetical protein